MALTKQQQAQFGALLNIWRTDIAAFAKDVFDSELRAKQIEFCEAFRNNVRVTFKGGVGFGKTHVMAVCVWWSLFCHNNVKISIFGPNEGQLKNGIWAELQHLHNRMDTFLADQWDVQSEEISRKVNHADCYARRRLASKENVSGISGIHAENNFIFVDEASGVADEVFKEALQNHLTTDINPKLILISNPKYSKGFFYDTWNDSAIESLWTKVHGKMSDSGLLTPERLAEATAQFGGFGSREYVINVEGDFPTDNEDALIASELIKDAIDYPEVIADTAKPIIWGVDAAGPGKDSTVLLKRQGPIVFDDIHERQGHTISQLSFWIRDMWQGLPKHERERVLIVIDANGLGQGLFDNLKDFGLPVFASKAQSRSTKGVDANGVPRYRKMRDQLWWLCKEWFETEAVSIPKNSRLVEELKAPGYSYDHRGAIVIESKDNLKKRLKRSPDFADALCLTFAVDHGARYVGKYSWSRPIGPTDLRMYE